MCPVEALEEATGVTSSHSVLGRVSVDRSTRWCQLGSALGHAFTSYLHAVCGGSQTAREEAQRAPLGLSAASISSILIGEFFLLTRPLRITLSFSSYSLLFSFFPSFGASPFLSTSLASSPSVSVCVCVFCMMMMKAAEEGCIMDEIGRRGRGERCQFRRKCVPVSNRRHSFVSLCLHVCVISPLCVCVCVFVPFESATF